MFSWPATNTARRLPSSEKAPPPMKPNSGRATVRLSMVSRFVITSPQPVLSGSQSSSSHATIGRPSG